MSPISPALLDAIGVKSATIVGLSIGGLIAQGLAAARPELVRGVVLMDTAHKIGTNEMWNGRIDAVVKGGIEAIANGVMERWFSPSFRATRTAELAGWRNMLVRTTVDGYAGSSAAIRDCDYEKEARALRVPVLGIGGSLDGATPPDLVKGTVAIIPNARFVLVEGAGHLPNIEMPEFVADDHLRIPEGAQTWLTRAPKPAKRFAARFWATPMSTVPSPTPRRSTRRSRISSPPASGARCGAGPT